MNRLARVAVLLAAATLMSVLPAQASPSVTPSTPLPTTLTEARIAAAQAEARVAPAEAAADSAWEAKRAAEQTVSEAEAVVQQAESALVAAETAHAQEQSEVESLARTMYMTGASSSPLDLFLVDPGERPGAALDTHAYLDSAANDAITQVVTAEQSMESAGQILLARRADLGTAQEALTQAQEALRKAQEALSQARKAAEEARRFYEDFIRQYTPYTGEALLDPTLCKNWLVRVLYKAGYRGEDLREAWAIAMRESGGREDAISASDDWGMFQFNRPTWGGQPWWDDELILTRDYNASIAFMQSDGGRTWLAWGLDGKGRANPVVYERSGWSEEMIYSHIVEPYSRWYKQYPCVDLSASQPGSAGTVELPADR